ncbi:hypothetical protein V1478_013973, partial [Vespula squamosa]
MAASELTIHQGCVCYSSQMTRRHLRWRRRRRAEQGKRSDDDDDDDDDDNDDAIIIVVRENITLWSISRFAEYTAAKIVKDPAEIANATHEHIEIFWYRGITLETIENAILRFDGWDETINLLVLQHQI